VVVDLAAARASLRPASARAARNDGTGVRGVLPVLANGRVKTGLGRGWRLTMAAALGQLPAGACLTVQDSDGREWYVGPASQAKAASFKEAV
jgi:hypothetical protein